MENVRVCGRQLEEATEAILKRLASDHEAVWREASSNQHGSLKLDMAGSWDPETQEGPKIHGFVRLHLIYST